MSDPSRSRASEHSALPSSFQSDRQPLQQHPRPDRRRSDQHATPVTATTAVLGGRRSALPSLADLAGLESSSPRPPSPSASSLRQLAPQSSPGAASPYAVAPPPAPARAAVGESYRPAYASQQMPLSPHSRPPTDAEHWEHESMLRRRAQSLTFAGQGHSPHLPVPLPATRHLSIEATTSPSQPWGAPPMPYVSAPPIPLVQAPRPGYHSTPQAMHSVMVDMGGQGPPLSMPLDISRASRDASEKRARNASASARFRARKRERDDANNVELSGLRQRLEDAQEDAEFYRTERDELVRVLWTLPGGQRYLPRPSSPRARRQRPRRESTAGASEGQQSSSAGGGPLSAPGTSESFVARFGEAGPSRRQQPPPPPAPPAPPSSSRGSGGRMDES